MHRVSEDLSRKVARLGTMVCIKGEKMERVMGIEPTLLAWEAKVLPLNYTRLQGAPILCGEYY